MSIKTKEKVNLTQDQQQAVLSFQEFMKDPDQRVFYLAGYAGVGKSSMIITRAEKSLTIIEWLWLK
jgi:hypothetical protein